MNDTIKIQMDQDYAYSLKNRGFSRDAIMWFEMLIDTIETYLCGLDEKFKIGMYIRRDEAVEWVHGKQDYQYCFNEVWLMFYDSDPEYVKKVLEKRYKERYAMYSKEQREINRAKNKNHDGRERETDTGDSNINGRTFQNNESDVWVESFLFEG